MSDFDESGFEYDDEEFIMYICCECDTRFAVLRGLAEDCCEYNDSIFCPNGHETEDFDAKDKTDVSMTADELRDAFGDV